MGPHDSVQHERLAHRIEPGDISYLLQGDRIRASRMRQGKHQETVLATVDMDGHRVSVHYGSRQGNTYYEDPQRNYINVKFDHVEYRPMHSNSTIRERDGWTVLVSEEVFDRIQRAKADEKNSARNEEKLRIIRKIEEAERLLADLKKQADAL